MIRTATEADIPAIVTMSRSFYETTHYTQLCGMDDETVSALTQSLISEHVMLVAENEGCLVGMVGLFVGPFMFNAERTAAYEVVWYVDPEARGAKVASALLEAIEPACKAKGATQIQMVLMPNSPPQAGALYERFGYFHSETSFTKRIN